MGKQKIDKCNEIVGHRSTPKPHSHSEWKSAEEKRKKNTFCLLSFSLYLYVIRSQQAVLPAVLQGVYLFLFCQKSSPGAKMNMKTSA